MNGILSLSTSLNKATLFGRWIGMLGTIMGPIRKQGVEELFGAILEVPWTWIEETDLQLRAQGAMEWMIEEWRAGVKMEVEWRNVWTDIDDLEELEG